MIPVTSPFRTLLNLAGLVEEPIQFELVFDSALRRGLLSPSRLIVQIADLEGSTVAGSKLLRRTFESRIGAAIPMSELETHFVNLVRRFGLPEPVLQYPVYCDGVLITTVDFAFPERKIAIECDGFGYHSIAPDWEKDLARANEFGLGGWLLLRFPWPAILWKGSEVCKAILRALELRRPQ